MIEAGTILQDRYRVMEQIGAGGMGAVYVATDQRFNSVVAIKETFFSDENLTRAFEREARLLNGLRHPALARVSDHFVDGNGQFIVMEFIDGDDLSEMMVKRGEAFPVADVLTWADQLLDALDYLHTQEMPIIHRDIKPQNLKLTPRGQITLLDFGLAKGNPANSDHQTNTKSIFGYSRVYAPLEQIQGTGTDPRSDFYSLAATLYHLVTGAPPEDALTRATAVLNGRPDPLKRPDQIRPELSASVANVILSAMALNANYRPSSAAAMRAVLVEAASNVSGDASRLYPVPEAQIFSQDTQVIDGSSGTGTAPRVQAFAAPTQQQISASLEPSAPAGKLGTPINISLPQTEVTQMSSNTAAPGKRRPMRAFMAIGAAAAGLILVVSAVAGLYSYRPEMFLLGTTPGPSVEEGVKTDTSEMKSGLDDNGAASGSADAAKEATAEKSTDDKVIRSVPSTERSAQKTAPQAVAPQTEDELDEAAVTADEEGGSQEQLEFQRAMKNLVQKRLKQANLKNKDVERQVKEAFDNMPESTRRGNVNRPVQPPIRPKVRIQQMPPDRPN